MKTRPFVLLLTLGGGLLLMAGILYLLLGAGGPNEAPLAVSLRPADPGVVKSGARIYAQQCAVCHGPHGEGQANWRSRGPDGLLPAPPHDASGHTWHHPDEQLFAITKYGVAQLTGNPAYRTAMPVFEDVLSDAEINAALSWIKAQWPPEIRQRHDRINEQHRKAG